MPDATYWCGLAADYLTAYATCFPSAGGIASEPSHRNAIVLAMSVAEHETNNSRAWPGTNDFGATQLRGLTPAELAAFQAGTLKAGDYTPSRDGVLHVDTHPTPSGPQRYPVWFAAFPTRVEGIAHFLKVLWRLSGGVADQDGCTSAGLAAEMYMRGYYEGAHAGARPVGQRNPPLTMPELANIADYGGAVEACRGTIEPQLAAWDYGLPENLEPVDPAAHDTEPPEAA